MQSDDRVRTALEATAPARERFRYAVLTALSAAKAILAAGAGAEQARAELGPFAAGRIDPEQFAGLSVGRAIDAQARGIIAYAMQALEETAERSDASYIVRAKSGESLANRVGSALTLFGRAFSAARAIDEARHGHATRGALSRSYPFEQWTSIERLVTPPVVIVTDGAHFGASEIASYLDGGMHVCVVIEGACPPAPLARLVTPGTLVVQTSGTRGLDRFADYEGPAIAAIVPSGAAEFIHDPRRGRMPWQRIDLWQKPAEAPRSRIGATTSRQQREDLEQLLALATPPALPEGSFAGMASADDVANRLSEWLLNESGLGGQR